ncbi:MAG: Ig-like domain-containing protein [Verrucomicrobia bacterium]|nr:Ig-like domain-containing protein [Verrucomicrobiota bacterium]
MLLGSVATVFGQPVLTIQPAGADRFTLIWSDTAAGFALEETASLSSGAAWRAVEAPVITVAGQLSLTVEVGTHGRFFRLRRSSDALTEVAATSPVHGETGVAVTRETIVRFSAPLAEDASLSRDEFFAGSGGRRLLSRVELSADRTTATLFYLEPMPGSTRITVELDASNLRDRTGKLIDADGDGAPGGTAIVSFDTLSLAALPDTAVIGTVYASELVPGADTGTNAVNKPLAGVTITVDGREETLRTVTDADGNFKLEPVPPGRFFVHIDGRTATDLAAGIRYPDQAYYPFVGKAWDAIAGRTDNLAGGTGKIYLPLIAAGTLQPVSPLQDTTITFPSDVTAANPALAGVSITVPANSLFADDGQRGGSVGIAAVPPDRLPGPLPPGAEMPLVITVQTDGALNFDSPVPACFPNLPNPTTGRSWPPGTRGSLISFNHKKGIWEDAGGMTVSADGRFFCTDPGVGILQPGWHGVQSPSPESPPPPPKIRCRTNNDLYDGCALACVDDQEQCQERVLAAILSARTNCYFFEGVLSEIELNRCLETVFLSALQRRTQCSAAYEKCQQRCVTCFGALASGSQAPTGDAPGTRPIQRSGVTPSDAHFLLDRLHDLADLIVERVTPFILDQIPIPAEVQLEIEALRGLADAEAGGDAVAYLREQIRDKEERNRARAAAAGLDPDDFNPGNAPAYPVLYAARVARPSGLLTLRGETAPLGQYSLFLPADGILQEVSFYDPRTAEFGIVVPNLSPQARYALPRFDLLPLGDEAIDRDQDGLPDVVEAVYGTDPARADTDGDGILDGAEIAQGTDPLGGFTVQTGVIASVATPGAAVDIVTGEAVAITAEGSDGISVFNIFDSQRPILIAHVDTPGNAQRVALAGRLAAVADGDAGLAVIDFSDPGTARIIHQVPLPTVQSVAAGAGLAYVGLRSGQLAVVDLASGTVLRRLALGAAVQDLALEGDFLYALTGDRLHVISLSEDSYSILGSVASPFVAAPNQRLFVGGSIAYTVHRKGYNTLDVADPARPVLLTSGNTTQFGWRQIVANGSGLGLAAVGPNSTDDGPHNISLYDLSDPRVNNTLITTFPTPGLARAVSLFNGLAYVADDRAGMQVINYLPYDSLGVPPSIQLATSFSGDGAESGQRARITAQVGDDVQVRHVEFYLDGVRAYTDGAFPFEFRFVAPQLNANKTSFRFRARATDTGGNSTWTEEQTVALLPDATPPRVKEVTPIGGRKVLDSLQAYFNEPIDPQTVTTTSLLLFAAGADGATGTDDDVPVAGGVAAYRAEVQAASLTFASPLPVGLYLAVVTSEVADLAGNRLRENYAWSFRVADAVFWVSPNHGNWDEPLNWSTGSLPGPSDAVIIDLPSVEVTVTINSGTIQVQSLVAQEVMRINSAVLQVAETFDLGANVTLNGGTIRGGTLRQMGGARMIFAALPSNTFDGVNVEGDLDLRTSSARLLIRNGLTLTGTVLLDNSGAIGFAGVQTLNTGSILFAGNSGFLSVEGNSTLTLGPAMVVRGKTGTLGQPVFAGGANRLINQGLISADGTGGTLTIRPTQFENLGTVENRNGGSVALLGGGWSNSGTVAATGGALTLAGSFANTGTIQAQDAVVNLDGNFTLDQLGAFQRNGGTVNLRSVLTLDGGSLTLDETTGSWTLTGGTIRGGTLRQMGGARMIFAALPSNTFDGVNVEGDLDLRTSSARLLIRNGLTLTGTVLLDNSGAIGFAGVQTLNTGSILFAGNSGFLSVEGNSTLTLGPAMVVRGKTGTLGQPVFAGGANRLINQGLISADGTGGTLTIRPTQFENTGTLQELNGGRIVIVP